MLYMIEAQSTGDYSFVTKQYGLLLEHEARAVVKRINQRMQTMFSPTVFYMTPVLDT